MQEDESNYKASSEEMNGWEIKEAVGEQADESVVIMPKWQGYSNL